MKLLTTKKDIKKSYANIIKIGYCQLQYLLRGLEPFAYSVRVEGWACDYYHIENIIFSTGYSAIGESISYEFIESYENKAREIWNSGEDYNIKKDKNDKLLKRFIEEIRSI